MAVRSARPRLGPQPLLAAVAVAAAAVLAACGGSSPAPAPQGAPSSAGGGGSTGAGGAALGGRPSPCTLLTLDEAQRVMGRAVAQDQATTSVIGEPQCRYTVVTSGTEIDVSSVEVKYTDQVTFDAVQRSGGQAGLRVTAVSGLGDEAMFQDAGGFTLLYVHKGSTYLIVTLMDSKDKATEKDREKQVAATAVSRL